MLAIVHEGCGIAVELFREVLVEDETQDVVAEFIGAHLAAEGVCMFQSWVWSSDLCCASVVAMDGFLQVVLQYRRFLQTKTALVAPGEGAICLE